MEHFLSLIIFFPAVAGALGVFIDERSIKTYAVMMSLIEFALSLFLLAFYEGGIAFSTSASIISAYGISYFIGVDGISLFLVILSTLMTFLALISLSIRERIKNLIISVLFLEMTMIGVFVALDAILFYIFWELSLIPMLYIIGAWGSGRRIYAGVKFFIYTFFGSMFLLVGLIAMAYLYYKSTGELSFNLIAWQGLNLPINAQNLLFLAFGIAFAIKTPMFPFHTWLPYAHGQAPTIGSVLLAAVLLKMGTYGFVRFSLPLFPDACVHFAPLMCILAVIMVIYTSFIAFAQKDIKQVVAYSSIAHMGVIILGIFSLGSEGISGAIFLMISHGITSGGLFMLVGFIYDRRHTKLLSEFGGLAKIMPVYAFCFGVVLFSGIGLPLTIGFVGEFLSLLGIYKISFSYALFGGFGIVMGAIYSLNLYKKTFFGKICVEQNKSLKDLKFSEISSIVPICVLCIFLGVAPNFMLSRISPSVSENIALMAHNAQNLATKNYIEKANFKAVINAK
ncbi:MAG: NADH-quinone oxidoreductase subunit M [Campylobacter sp.]|nr:NADH-quinone oxidoreductase subunit M [Campylobacter sp.]